MNIMCSSIKELSGCYGGTLNICIAANSSNSNRQQQQKQQSSGIINKKTIASSTLNWRISKHWNSRHTARGIGKEEKEINKVSIWLFVLLLLYTVRVNTKVEYHFHILHSVHTVYQNWLDISQTFYGKVVILCITQNDTHVDLMYYITYVYYTFAFVDTYSLGKIRLKVIG